MLHGLRMPACFILVTPSAPLDRRPRTFFLRGPIDPLGRGDQRPVPPVRLLLLPAILVAGVAPAHRASAADPRAMTWTVRAAPDCGPRAAHFAREVELACDAVGHGCRVVDAGGERQAVLTCPRVDPWTLEARTDAGVRLWTVALGERPESRLRVAAMWLARAERDAPPPEAKVIAAASAPPRSQPPPPAPPDPPPPDAQASRGAAGTASTAAATSTPPPATAATSPRSPVQPAGASLVPARTAPSAAPASVTARASALPPSSTPAPVASPSSPGGGAPGTRDARDAGPVAADAPAGERTEPAPARARGEEAHANRGGLAVALRGGLGGDLAPGSLGGSFRAALGLPLRTNASLVVTGEQAVGAASGYSLTVVRAGAGFGWGAPWSAHDLLGASLDAGAALGALSAPSGVTPASASFVSPYAQLSVFGRLRARGPFRPWVALSVAALADTVRVAEGTREVTRLPRPSAALDVGVAWAAW
jgi:hypothetical protein